MADDASRSTNNLKAVSIRKPELPHSTVGQPQQFQANLIEGKHTARDAMALPRSGLEAGDTAIDGSVSGGNRPAAVLLGDFGAGGARDRLDWVTKDSSDSSETSTAKALPGSTSEAFSELKEIDSDCTPPKLPAVGVALHAEGGSSRDLAGDALGRAEGEDKKQFVSGSGLTRLIGGMGGPCGASAEEDTEGESSWGKRSENIPAGEGGDGDGKGRTRHSQEVLVSPGDPCLTAGESKGASSGGRCSAPERRSAVASSSWQQPQQETRLLSKAVSQHGPASPRASSVWDLDSLSDEEDGISEREGRRGEAAEGLLEEYMEGARESLGEARAVPSGLPQRLEKLDGDAFQMPPPKRARVEEPISGVDEDEGVSKSDGKSGRESAGASRDDVSAVALAVAEAKENARQLMPPPPPNIGRAKMRHRRSRVTLMHSPRYQRLCGLVERNSRRDDLLYALLGASGLPGRLSVVAPAFATGGHLRSFHDRAYIEALRSPPSDPKALEEYGLVDDCEAFEELYDYCCAVAGASIHAADRLCRGEADVAINWGGGRHHAKKGEAAGFCYVNDGVLAVLHLIKTFSRVLTIDIDVHHGDGIQEAFYMSDKVMTVSYHHLAKGFFPGAGHCFETGAGSGRGFNLNVPLREGCGDACFSRVFMEVVSAVVEGFRAEAVVILCGADTLSSDPLGPFNLTSAGIRECVGKVVALNLPLLMLGGGGYCPTDTARLWTTLTAAAIGPEAVSALPATIPDHAYFPLYGPDFRMATRQKSIPDKNDEAYLVRLCEFVAQAGRRARNIRQSRETQTFQEYADNGSSW